jgi:2-polyprenyl-3-methyl-5-hydroxy-6-metoxy-1,4-benzoquinol methylase
MESLPFRSDLFSVTLAIDVVEHVDDPRSILAEAARVLALGGCLWLTTPNRFSLTPEPHVGLWGVRWLHGLLLTIGPYFQVTCTKAPVSGEQR